MRAHTRVLWIGPGSRSASREATLLAGAGFEVVMVGNDQEGNSPTAMGEIGPTIQHLLAGSLVTRPNSEIGRQLSSAFDLAVIESDIDTYSNYIRTFRNPIVFRCYGMGNSVGEVLWDKGTTTLARYRNDLKYLPSIIQAADIEEAWIRDAASYLPSLQATADDVSSLIRSKASRPASPVAIVAPIGQVGYDRRQSAAVYAARAVIHDLTVLTLPVTSESELGLALLEGEALQTLSQASALLYLDASRSVIAGFVQQALLLDIPIVYLSNSLPSRMFGTSRCEVNSVSEAVSVVAMLTGASISTRDEIVASQRNYLRQMTNSQLPENFSKTISTLCVELMRRQKSSDSDATEVGWRQLAQVNAALSIAPELLKDASPQSVTLTRQIVECLFEVALQRRPGLLELGNAMMQLQTEARPDFLLQELLQSEEGRSLWPQNRFRAWL